MTRCNLKITIIFLSLLIFGTTAQAQLRICTSYVPHSGFSDSLFTDIKKPQPNFFHAKCLVPDEYEAIADSNFITKNASSDIAPQKIKITEPIIEEVTDSIVLKKIYSKWVINTAIKPPKRVRILAPIYKDSVIWVVVEKERFKWVATKGDADYMSQNSNNCLVLFCLKVPEQYQRLHYLHEIKPPRKIVAKDTIALNAAELEHFGTIETKNEQIIYYHETLKQMARVDFPIANNAEYVLPNKKLVRKGGMAEWDIINKGYSSKRSQLRVEQIRAALTARGYKIGQDEFVKPALVQLQKDNNLPIGSLDLQTMKALGLKISE